MSDYKIGKFAEVFKKNEEAVKIRQPFGNGPKTENFSKFQKKFDKSVHPKKELINFEKTQLKFTRPPRYFKQQPNPKKFREDPPIGNTLQFKGVEMDKKPMSATAKMGTHIRFTDDDDSDVPMKDGFSKKSSVKVMKKNNSPQKVLNTKHFVVDFTESDKAKELKEGITNVNTEAKLKKKKKKVEIHDVHENFNQEKKKKVKGVEIMECSKPKLEIGDETKSKDKKNREKFNKDDLMHVKKMVKRMKMESTTENEVLDVAEPCFSRTDTKKKKHKKSNQVVKIEEETEASNEVLLNDDESYFPRANFEKGMHRMFKSACETPKPEVYQGTFSSQIVVDSESNRKALKLAKKRKSKEASGDAKPKKLKQKGGEMSEDRSSANALQKSQSTAGETDIDTQNRTLFVSNIPKDIGHRDLQNHFKSFGKIQSARIRSGVSSGSKNYKKVASILQKYDDNCTSLKGYVVFEKPDDAKKALAMKGYNMNGHHLGVSLLSENTYDKNLSVFVGNLPFDAEDEMLWTVFSSCGTINNVRIIRDRETGIGKGFGFVVFEDEASVQAALTLNETEALGRTIRVQQSKDNQERPKTNKVHRVHHRICNKYQKPESTKTRKKVAKQQKRERGKKKIASLFSKLRKS